MSNDAELLRSYAITRSEGAFRELVQRHYSMVYFAALRRLRGDVQRAQEVAQDVFIDLGRKAAALARRPTIHGWLYISACYAAAKAVRATHRKRLAEEKSALYEQLCSAAPATEGNTILSPLLDEALLQLSERNREAVLLRFFQGLTYPEIAERLKLTEDGARLRVTRALEKLRSALARRGVASTAAALSTVLTSQAGLAAPAGISTAIAAGALQQLSAGSAGALYLFAMTKTTLVIGLLVLAGAVGILYKHYAAYDDAALRSSARSVANHGEADKSVETKRPDSLLQPNLQTGTTRMSSGASASNAEARLKDPKAELLSDLSRGVFRVDELSDLGNATPRAAAESFLWAIAHASDDTIASMFDLSESQKAALDSVLQRLPKDARAKYRDPEHILALFAAREGTIVPAEGTIQITSEVLAANNEVKITTHIDTTPEQYKSNGLSPTNSSDINIRNTPNGWKVVVPDYAIKQIAPAISVKANHGKQ